MGSKGQSVKIRGKGLATFTKDGKHRSGKHWWRTWSSLAGGLDADGNDREATGYMTFVDTYIPEGIYDIMNKHIRRRTQSDPEPKPCALLLKIMAEEFPEHEKSNAGETSIKVGGSNSVSQKKSFESLKPLKKEKGNDGPRVAG